MPIRLSARLLGRLAFFCCISQAGSAETTLDEIVVVANRSPVTLRTIGSSVTVLDGAAIEQRGKFSLASILRELPGIAVNTSGPPGSTTALRIRGEEAYRTLTIVDGIRISDPASPQISPLPEHLLSGGTGRLEILRGPQGLAYGADAGGVIMITSPVAREKLQLTAEAQAGSFGTQQTHFILNGGNAGVDALLQLTDFSTDGFNSRPSDNVMRDIDGYENQTIQARLGVNPSEQLRVEWVHREVDSNGLYDGCYDTAFNLIHDCDADYQLTADRLGVEFQTATVRHELSVNSADTSRVNYSAGLPAFTADGKIQRLEYQGQYDYAPGLSFLAGADYEKARNGNEARNNKGIWFEVLSEFMEQFYLSAGLRADDNDDFGKHTSYRMSAAWLANPDAIDGVWKIRGSLGTGFRAPSLYELAYNGGPFASAPAAGLNLREENSAGYELGLEYYQQKLEATLVYFDQNITNAIVFDLSNYSGYLQEAGKGESRGYELSATYSLLDSWRIAGNYTYNMTRTPAGLKRLRRPEQLANLRLEYNSLDFPLTIAGALRVTGAVYDEQAGSRISLPGYSVLDFSAHYDWSKGFSLFARVENVLDKEYRDIADFNVAGRAVYVGLRYRL